MKNEVFTPQMGSLKTKGTGKRLDIIFIVDVSGSMRGHGRIEAVNSAFTQMIPALQQIQQDSMSEFELKIAIMTFDQTARWIVSPTPIMEYNHEELQCSEWVTYFSRAFRTLGEQLTRKEYMAHAGKLAQPYIMLLTDGEPTPDDDYQPELGALLENGWFRVSQRFAVLIGKDAINSQQARDAVAKFVSSPTEGIIDASDAAAIVAEVQAKTIHTIKVATRHGVPSGDADTGKQDSGDFDDFGGFGDNGFDQMVNFDDSSFI